MRSYSLTTPNTSPWVLHLNYTHLVLSLISKRDISSRINHRNDPTLSLKSQAFLVKSFALFLIEQTLKGTDKNPQAHHNREKMGLIRPISLPKNFTEQMEPIWWIRSLGNCPEFCLSTPNLHTYQLQSRLSFTLKTNTKNAPGNK